ncbi:penicillin-binding transpeptidase domain-containing protein [Streptomyces meridianus]|uniref:Penicillin-binding transpeptidase domain-containing protein n=1 Tax=Streptomyces meridianus TaxID=2938945 RepID=A0ABT0X369_9ACTN|nr:penicillin-binding transpeptidase domain-containing protein [Streptomyces meridianus]MCM2576987.1 penicillin-binding transpeptidase domain-containing protein [Streptomyces meridianus]
MRVKSGIVGAVVVVVVGCLGYGAYNIWNGLSGGAAQARVKSGPPDENEIRTTATKFLAAWAKGDADAAAQLTDNAVDARVLLSGYRTDAHVTKATIKPGTPNGATVRYTVRAEVSYRGKTEPWSYTSSLRIVRGVTTGRALVDWQPSVIHPELKKGESIRTGEAASPPIRAVDRNGVELTGKEYPSLGPLLDTLRERYGDRSGGKPGITTQIESTVSDTASHRTLLTLAQGRPGRLRTTVDARIQAAAERAVRRYAQSSVVAIQPSTGEIRAVANHRTDAFNAAMEGRLAPGSTMKIVTAAMLMEKGVAAAGRTAECPKTVMYQGRTFRNLDHFSTSGRSFADSFARSCNTAFIKLIDDTGDDAALPRTAREVFGIGLDWKTGVTSFDGSVPEVSGGEAAAEYIGQGQVAMNPLNMASVTATAASGVFHQPVLVDPSLDGRQLAVAARRMTPQVARQLRDMMRLTAVSGTGARAMSGLGGDKGAKTGSAEVDQQGEANSWFTAFQDDLAAAAVVQSGGHGGDAAGPLVAAVLGAD